MPMVECYLGLGSNLGNSKSLLNLALESLKDLKGVFFFQQSRLFSTSPVSDIPQNDYVNAVCKFKTTLDVLSLYEEIKKIEIRLGKTAKLKNAPRLIDIDILFFGRENIETQELTIPHPQWKHRLFVLKPLRDLTRTVALPPTCISNDEEIDLEMLLENFINIHQEKVIPLDGP